ncbi:MAG: sporulation protein YqfD [Coprococcus sp.]
MSVVSNYVCCRVTGDAGIRFVNLCKNNGIELENLIADGNGFLMSMRVEDFKKLRPMIRKTHVKVHIMNRRGPAFFFYRHHLRLWFIAGLALCSLMIWYMSLFIWQIDISGNSKYTDDLILQSLRILNVDTGCKKSELSLTSIEEELRIMYNQITWVSASVTGTRLHVEIKEGNLQTENENGDTEDIPSNLTAASDAIITSMVIRHGTASVKTGDIVQAGDVLVEGKVYIYNEDETLKKIDYTRADADIMGDYEEYYKKDYPVKYPDREYTEAVHTGIALELWKNCLELPDFYNPPENCEKWTWAKKFRLTPTFYLPFAIQFTEYVPYEIIEKNYTEAELRQMASEDLQNYLNELTKKGVQIIRNSVTILLDADGGHAEGVLYLNGPIDQRVPIDSSSMAAVR